MPSFPTRSPSYETQPGARRRSDAPPRLEPLPRRRHDREQREALRHRAMVSAWLRTLSRAR
jgi:hypothetical protein